MTMRRLLRALATTVIAIGLAGATATASRAAPPTPTDLGTLGGTYAVANGINNSGQVVGESATAGGYGSAGTHAFLWDPVGGMVDLGHLGSNYSIACAINDARQVVGYSGYAYPYNDGDRAFLWDPVSGMVDYSRIFGPWPSDINDAGQVLGAPAFLWDPVGGRVDLYERNYPFPGDAPPYAAGINDAGKVVGGAYTAGNSERHAVLWESVGDRVDLGTLGGTESGASDINDAGQVVGFSDTLGGTGWHAFVWDPVGGMVDLGTLGGTQSWASGINDAGQVVGSSYTPGDAELHAFVWDPVGGMVDLGTLGGTWAQAEDINDAGQIVGGASTAGEAEYHAVLWDVAAPVDTDAVGFTVTGGINYTNTGALTGGNLAVARDSRGITSVTGTGTFASSVSGSAEATFNVRRFWILPAYTGTVRIADPAAGVALNHAVFFSRVNADGTEGATNTQGWFDLSHWPWRTYSLTWTVQDHA